jgi:hypothetical protein
MNEGIRGKLDILALSLTVSAECELNDLVVITDDNTVTKAGAGKAAIGTLIALPSTFPGIGTVQTKYNVQMDVIAGATVVAGDFAKVGTPSNSKQRFIKFVPGTDDPTLNIGQFLTGGAVNAVVSLLTW